MIQDGKKFPGPIELVQHHKTRLDGFITKPNVECKRPEGYPKAWPGVTYLELERLLFEQMNMRKLRVSLNFQLVEMKYLLEQT